MKSKGNQPVKGFVEVDETVVGGNEEGTRGRKNGSKKLVVIAIEHSGKGIGRMYGKVIACANNRELGQFMKSCIDNRPK